MKKFMMILTLTVAYFAATATAGAIPPPNANPTAPGSASSNRAGGRVGRLDSRPLYL